VKVFLLCVILGLTGWATLCRLVRGETLKLRELDYVQAAVAFGVSPARIMARHILPNVTHLVLITTVLSFSDLILFEAVLTYMHALAWEAADLLTTRWHTTFETPRDMLGAMVTVPLPERAGTTDDDARRLRLSLLVDDRIEVHVHAWRGRLWTRVSAQIYNDRSDIERLANAVLRKLG